jgi:alkyl hydroperoxide reductase subunit AhpC
MLFPETVEDVEFQSVQCGGFDIVTKRLSDFKGKYCVLLFYPLDFTFVCPTEIVQFSKMEDEFRRNNTEIIFISGDSVYSHLAWNKLSVEAGGIGNVPFYMASDLKHSISSQFNLFNHNSGTVMRSTVILNKDLQVLHISANIDPIGRSTKEILRLIKAFEFQSKHAGVCPVDFETE